jgi:secreted trypsin-like serine protease
MKLFIFVVLIAGAFADFPADHSQILPISELPGFWDGTEFEQFTYKISPRNSRIIGGDDVLPNAHPYQVALHVTQTAYVGLCGGSIISTRSILTAGHCVARSSIVEVIAGVHNRNIQEATQQRRTVNSTNYRVHPNFNPSNLNNDLAVLIAAVPFNLNVNVQLVRLPIQFATELFVGEPATSLGWGRITVNGQPSNTLRRAVNPVIANAQCSTVYGPSIVVASTICVSTVVGPNPPATGACHGDDGGVLSVPRVGDPRPIQIGVTSFFSPAGCVVGHPIVFERVTSHLPWIQANF